MEWSSLRANPALRNIDSSSEKVYASPWAVEPSIIMLNAAGVDGEIRSSLGMNSSVTARPPGARAAWTLRRNFSLVGASKWCRKLVIRTRS